MEVISVGANSYFFTGIFFCIKLKAYGPSSVTCRETPSGFASLAPAALELLCTNIRDPERKSRLDVSSQKTRSGQHNSGRASDSGVYKPRNSAWNNFVPTKQCETRELFFL